MVWNITHGFIYFTLQITLIHVEIMDIPIPTLNKMIRNEVKLNSPL